MKKLLLIAAMLILIPIVSLPSAASAEDNILIEKKLGFLTEDKNVSSVSLYGTKEADSPFYKGLNIIVRDRKGNIRQKIIPSQNAGYSPDIFLADFTGKGFQQILLSIQSGGSGAFGYYYIYDLYSGRAETIFDFEAYSLSNKYTAFYQNYYRVQVISANSGERYMIDLSLKDKEYLESIYRPDGILKEPKEAFVSDLNTLYPVYNSEKGYFDIMVLQRVTGLYNADLLGYLITKQGFNENKFESDYILMGTLGYGNDFK